MRMCVAAYTTSRPSKRRISRGCRQDRHDATPVVLPAQRGTESSGLERQCWQRGANGVRTGV
eukprot:7056749-Prymnesium_polylepis.1